MILCALRYVFIDLTLINEHMSCPSKTAHDPDMLPAMDEQPIHHSLQIKTEI